MKFLSRKNILYYLIIFFAVVFYIGFILRASLIINGVRYFSLFDDAMISMRYAKNLATGYGLVWNPGEYVEGYTNFLWVLWMSFLHFIPVSESKITLLVSISGIVILILNLLVVKSLAQKLSNDSFIITALSLILTTFYYGLVFWTLRGMEVGLLTLFIDISVLLIFKLQDNFSNKNFVILILVIGGIFLVRADTLVFIIFFLLYFYFTVHHEKRTKTFLIFISAILIFISAQIIFRIVYYEDFLPNTYYLKLDNIPAQLRISRGFFVFRKGFLSNLTALVLPCLLFISFYYKEKDKKRIFCLAGVFILSSLYSIYVGGDAWEGLPYTSRYITVSIPLLIILCSISLYHLYYKFKSNKLFFLSSIIFITYLIFVYVIFENLNPPFITLAGQKTFFIILSLAYIFTFTSVAVLYHKKLSGKRFYEVSVKSSFFLICILTFFIINEFAYSTWLKKNVAYLEKDKYNIELGLKIRENTSEDTKIAVTWAGAIPYYSNRYSVDLLGKMDKYIAKGKLRTKFFLPGHTKWDHIYSINKYKPDLIIELAETPKDSLKSILDNEYDSFPGFNYVKKGTSKINSQIF